MFQRLNTVWIIALNDLRAAFRERPTLINIFVLPVFMTILLAFATSANGSSGGTVDMIALNPTDAFSLGFIAQVKAEMGGRFTVCVLSQPGALPDSCQFSAGDGGAEATRTLAETRVKGGKSAAAVILPADFGEQIAAGNAVTLSYITGDDLNATVQIGQKLEAVLTRLNASVATARAAVKLTSDAASYQKVYAATEAIWAGNPVSIRNQTSTGSEAVEGTGFGQSAPGFGAMFVLINAMGLATIFVEERTTWTLQRLMMMPVARWQILAGKLLGRYLLCLCVFAVLIGVGALFGTKFGDPLGVIATALAYTLAATAIALAFSTIVRSKSQAANLGFLVAMIAAPLGGAWWPLSIVPDFMRALGQLSPIAWSQAAFSKLSFNGGTLLDVLPFIGVLLIFAAVFFAFGLRRFRYV